VDIDVDALQWSPERPLAKVSEACAPRWTRSRHDADSRIDDTPRRVGDGIDASTVTSSPSCNGTGFGQDFIVAQQIAPALLRTMTVWPPALGTMSRLIRTATSRMTALCQPQ
jgi:hypothetical protein